MKKIILLVVLIQLGCENDAYDFPQVNVNLNLYINNPEFFNIEAPGGWIYLNGGVAGILLYRKNLDEFIAYDRASTYNPVEDCAITVDSDNIILKDPCSDSQFLITDGSVIQGPASQALKRYSTNLYGSNLSIYN